MTFAAIALIVLAGLAVQLVLSAAPAPAAFPGQNGKIAFRSDRDGNAEIYLMNADGSGQTNLTRNPAFDTEPAFSPNGAQVAFTTNRDGRHEVYLMNADGSDQSNLSRHPARDFEPAFSPNGEKIAFATNRDGNHEVYVMDADGSDPKNLTSNPARDSSPSFSPDGETIVFDTDRDGNNEVYAMDADGSDQRNLSNNSASDLEPSFSPGGEKVIFNTTRDGNFEVYGIDPDGAHPTNLTNTTADEVEGAFSPDGQKIAFGTTRDGNWEIYVMDSDGSDPVQLTTNAAMDIQTDWGLAPELTDTAPPETGITGGPTGTTSDRTAAFTFGSSEANSTFECRVGSAAFSRCTSPYTTASLGDGSHTFEVRATDAAGNQDPTPASRSWTILADYRGEVLGTSGLVSYWRLGEASGTTAADAKGANRGGYRNGVALGRSGALLHDSNTSASFDGSNDFVSVADHASLDTGNQFTLEAWVKRASTSSSTKTVLSKGSGSWRLSFVNNVLTLTKAGTGTIAKASVSTTDSAGFHHVVATKSGATVRLYIDGVARTGAVTNRTVANSSTALNIGRHTSGSEYFPGLIDEVAVYNVALSGAQVQRHYQASGR